MKKNKEKRNAVLNDLAAETDKMQLRGYAAVYESPTVLYEYEGVEYKEVIERGAFSGVNMSDCCLKYNHSDSVPVLARVRGGSLKITPDDKGLYFEADLFDTTSARDVYALVKQGGLDKCSFAFTIADESYDKLTHTRTIKKIDKLFDISIVDIPAYDATDVSARGYFEAEAEKLKSSENETLKKRLLLTLELDK